MKALQLSNRFVTLIRHRSLNNAYPHSSTSSQRACRAKRMPAGTYFPLPVIGGYTAAGTNPHLAERVCPTPGVRCCTQANNRRNLSRRPCQGAHRAASAGANFVAPSNLYSGQGPRPNVAPAPAYMQAVDARRAQAQAILDQRCQSGCFWLIVMALAVIYCLALRNPAYGSESAEPLDIPIIASLPVRSPESDSECFRALLMDMRNARAVRGWIAGHMAMQASKQLTFTAAYVREMVTTHPAPSTAGK